MVKPAAQSFLYREVLEELRKRIVSGIYPVGSTIPSLSTLVKSFGVSPITIRRALHTLTFEGLLFGRQGRGVFVADRKRIVRTLSSSMGWPLGSDILRAGYTPTIEEISYTAVKRTTSAPKPRKLTAGAIYRHEKRIFANDVPIALDIVYLPSTLAKQMRDHLKDRFVFALIDMLKIPVQRADFEFSSTFATDHEVQWLTVVPQSPLIVANYVLYGDNGEPLLEGHTTARAERMAFALSSTSLAKP